jgi:hypothetical protein
VFTWLPAKLLSEHLAIGLPAEVLVLETSIASFPNRPNWETRAIVVQMTELEKGREFSFKCQSVVASDAPPGVIMQIEPSCLILADWKGEMMRDHLRGTLSLRQEIADCSPDARLTNRGWDSADA